MDVLLSQARMILWMVLHFRWVALAGAAIVALAGWTVVFTLPDQYESKTLVYLDTDSVLNPLLKGLAVDNSVREQSAVIVRRTLLTRPNLQEVIRLSDLDLTLESDEDTEALMLSFLDRVEVEGHANKRRDDANIYSITFHDDDPALAQRVVDSLLNVFLERVLGFSRMDASKAQSFIDGQIEQYRARLEDVEERLGEFRRENPEAGQASTYYSRLSDTQVQLEDAKLMLTEAQQRAANINEQIGKVSKTLSASSDEGVGEPPPLSPEAERLERLQIRLDDLLLQYTDVHPDVIATRKAIEQIGLEVAAEQSAAVNNEVEIGAKYLAENPVYQELTVERAEVDAVVAALTARVAEYERRIESVLVAIEDISGVGAELTKLSRDYDVTLATYDDLIARRESAGISQSAEETGEQMQFRIVEPPTLPLIPTGPNRPLLLSAVFFGAIGIGGGASFLLALIRGSVYTRAQLSDDYGLPVLGTVSMVWSQEQISRRSRGVIVFGIAAVVLLTVYGGNMFVAVVRHGSL